MQAIQVKFLGPTNFRGSRYKAWAQAGSVTLSSDHALNPSGNARKAAEALATKLGWTYGELIEGGLPNGDYVFTFNHSLNRVDRKARLNWQDGEVVYCCKLVESRGNDNVSHDPVTIANYLRLQASSAYRDGEIDIAARLGEAATAINHDGRSKHAPDWNRALAVFDGIEA